MMLMQVAQWPLFGENSGCHSMNLTLVLNGFIKAQGETNTVETPIPVIASFLLP